MGLNPFGCFREALILLRTTAVVREGSFWKKCGYEGYPAPEQVGKHPPRGYSIGKQKFSDGKGVFIGQYGLSDSVNYWTVRFIGQGNLSDAMPV